jgi:peroxiredoxin
MTIQAETTADDAGHYQLDHIPPGDVMICMAVDLGRSGTLSSEGHTQAAFLAAAPGASLDVPIGGKGRPVIGRLVPPLDMAPKIEWFYASSYVVTDVRPAPRFQRPPGWNNMTPQEQRQALKDWSNTPEVRAATEAQAKQQYLPFLINSDGTFRVDDVLAGSYTLQVVVRHSPATVRSAPGSPISMVSQRFVIPDLPAGADRSDESFDLGGIGLAPAHALNVGDPAPDFNVFTLDGKPLRFTDFHGKVVLIHFWSTRYPACAAELPNLQAAADAFARDARFTIVTLNLDERPNAPRAFAARQPVPGTSGFLGAWADTRVPGQWGVEGLPTTILVGPDGKVLARDLRGPTLRDAIDRALNVQPPAPTR